MQDFISKKMYLLFIFTQLGWTASSFAQALPKLDAPVGIRNAYGCCYVVQFLQLMYAVQHVIPGTFDEVLKNRPYGLLDGYMRVFNDTVPWNIDKEKGFASQHFVLDPDSFVRAFVMVVPELATQVAFEERKLPDGTVKKIDVGAWQEAAKGGRAEYVMKAFLEQWNASCKERTIGNPFECSFVLSSGKNESYYYFSLSELCGASIIDEHYAAQVNFSRLLPHQATLTQCPQFLIAINMEEKPFVPPLSLSLCTEGLSEKEISDTIVYEGLACGYSFPVFLQDKGFKGNHGIAIVRYDSVFYLCNNELITPFMNSQSVLNWMIRASQTSYLGPGLPRRAWSAIVPRIAIYKRLDSHGN